MSDSFESFATKPIGKRIHLVEFHELSWFPGFLREAIQDILALGWEFEDGLIARRSVAKQVGDDLARICRRTGTTSVLDMCSGGGGPVAVLARINSLKNCKFTLTDLHPNLPAFHRISSESGGRVGFCDKSVDATKCDYRDGNTKFLRTMFASMHHMQPPLLKGILKDCVGKGNAFGAFEITNRSIFSLLHLPFTVPAIVIIYVLRNFLRNGFIKGLVCALFAIPIPIIPLTLLIDGWTSCLRTYSRKEFMAIAEEADPEHKYDWVVVERFAEGVPLPLTVYIGLPAIKN